MERAQEALAEKELSLHAAASRAHASAIERHAEAGFAKEYFPLARYHDM